MRTLVLLTAVAAAACSGEITGGEGGDGGAGGGPDGAPGEASLRFTAPAPDSEHERAELDGDGVLVAPVALAVEATGGITRVEYVLGGVVIGEAAGPDFALTYGFALDGAQQLDAFGYGADGEERASATVSFRVTSPDLDDCYAWLDLYGVTYTRGPDNQGVAAPVTVTTPIAGIEYRYVSNEQPRGTFFMDCSLARSLVEAGPLLRARDVVEVADIGVYNYRCIGGGTPPDCTNGISQHAYAKAIDLAGFTTSDGTFYSVNDDWVIDAAGESTCAAAAEAGKDAWLHEAICALKGADVWAIVLTPNYNDAHRNHFHVDLTTGSDFIRSGRPLPVNQGPDGH